MAWERKPATLEYRFCHVIVKRLRCEQHGRKKIYRISHIESWMYELRKPHINWQLIPWELFKDDIREIAHASPHYSIGGRENEEVSKWVSRAWSSCPLLFSRGLGEDRDRAAFLRLGGLNKMPKFLARAAGASVLGGSGGMLPRKIFKMLLEWLKIHPNIADKVNSFIIYQANKHQIWTKITKQQTREKSQQLLFSTLTNLNQWIYQSCENGFHFAGQVHSLHLEAELTYFICSCLVGLQ